MPDNHASAYIDRLEKQAAELKSSIQYSGGHNLVYKQSDTGSTYDWTGTISGLNQSFNVTATGSTATALLGDLVWYVWVNGVRTMLSGYTLFSIYPLPHASDGVNVLNWYVHMGYPNNTDVIGIKAYVLATDNVTISVVPI